MHLDMRTIILSHAISSAICAGVIAIIWQQHRRRWAGLDWWLANYLAQFAAFALITLRGIAPDWASVVVANTLIVAGALLLYGGLARFLHQRVVQTHNVILLAAFSAVHAYFVAQPSLAVREINISVALLVICAQCAWLMLRQIKSDLRPIIRWLGVIWVGYCLTSLARIILAIALPPGNDFFAESNPFDAWVSAAYQTLSVALTFGLVVLVNRRLMLDLQIQGEALRLSEDKFAKAFNASPDAILITRLRNGRIVEVNEGFCRLSGYTREEAMGNSILTLRLWANPQQHAEYITALRAHGSVRDCEYDFIAKSGARLTCLCSGQVIYLDDQVHILSVVRDITEARVMQECLMEQQQAEAALAERERLARDLHDSMTQSLHSLSLLADTAQHMVQHGHYAALPDLVETLRAGARQALRDMRLLVYELQLASPDGMDLSQLLQDRLAHVEQRAGLKTHLSVRGGGHIPPPMRAHIFFIASEALNNILRHARAAAVNVQLEAAPGLVELRVSDDGCGFDAPHAEPGMGLRNMQTRADELGGQLTVDSAPGRGATIHLRVSFEE